jgi:hypothetical protein
MIGWIFAGAFGLMGYKAYRNEKIEKMSFHNNGAKKYKYFGTMWLFRSNEGTIHVFVDEQIFCRIRKKDTKDMFRVGDFPIGGRLTQILEKPDGSKEIIMDKIITDSMVEDKYYGQQGNDFAHGLWIY